MRTTTLVNRFASTSSYQESAEQHILKEETQDVYTYYLNNHRHSFHEYPHFRFILKPDGSLWHDGNLFMFHKVKQFPGFSDESFTRYEQALREFIAFCEESRTDYWNPTEEYDAATDRFKKHLEENERSPSTIERLMPVITAFYEWMKEKNGFDSEIPLWREEQVRNPHPEFGGGEYYTIKDVCKADGNNQMSDGAYIYDKGKLRPLSRKEEQIILKALDKIGNPEYRLVFHLGLVTFARKQTILTLRLHHILDALPGQKIDSFPRTLEDVAEWKRSIKWPDDLVELPMLVGKGHNADVKGGKTNYTITIRGWLWKRIVTYMLSHRAYERRLLATPKNNELDQYLFLSDEGNPMYHAKNDPGYHDRTKRNTEEIQRGNSLDQFIKTLRQHILRRGYDIEFHFHCLRATGGVRFLESRAEGKKSYSRFEWAGDLRALQKLMNHADPSSTLGYLEYIEVNKRIEETIDKANEYQLELMSLFDSGTRSRSAEMV
jgi:hypothetical protein